MEKRVLLAAALSIAFLSVYASIMGKMYPQPSPKPGTAPRPATMSAPATSTIGLQPIEPEDVIVLDSETLRVEIGRSSAAIRSVTLKEFRAEGDNQLKIANSFALLSVRSSDGPLAWQVTSSGPDQVSFSAKEYHLSYSLNAFNALLDIVLSKASGVSPIELVSVWSKADQLSDRNNPIEASLLQQKNGDKLAYRRVHGAQKTEKIVPRGTISLALTERYFCQILKPAAGAMTVSLLPSPAGTIAARAALPADQSEHRITLYMGPRDFFHLQRAEMQKAFEIGVLGQIGLILLKVLSFVAGLTRNYGIAIILFAAGITLLMGPFTLIGMRSMKRMQELRPQIDRIMAQNKDNPTKANQEVFALYRQYKISPMSGCLPMLLQMPIFIALFQAISHYIELRGASFLWIKDLSLPDRVAMLPFNLPLLGHEFNILPIIMAGAMFLQTKLQSGASSASAGAQQDPTAKILSGPMMSIVFGVMFYHFPSGLVLYWLTNNLVSISLYRLAK